MIKFYRGLRTNYSAETHADGIYFATDTFEILMNNQAYVGAVADAELDETGKILTVLKSDGTSLEVEVGATGEYDTVLEDTLSMPNAVGGIAAGTTVADLKGMSYDALFNDLLFPTVNPSHGTPSLTGFTLSPSTSPVEIGATVATASAAGLNKATWTTYNDGLAYAGDITSTEYTYTINGTTYTATDTLPTDLPEMYTATGSHTYKAVVNYAEGPVPVNNKGVEVESLACPAGNVTATRTINVTLPWYASTEDATEDSPVVKQKLVSWNATAGSMSTGNFVVQPSGTLPQVFKLPRQLKTLLMLNTVSNQMETISTTAYTETTEVMTFGGVEFTYYVYTYNGDARGSVTLLAKF